MILQRRVATPTASAASSSLRIASNARPRRLRSSADVRSAAANATTHAHQYAGYPLTVSGPSCGYGMFVIPLARPRNGAA